MNNLTFFFILQSIQLVLGLPKVVLEPFTKMEFTHNLKIYTIRVDTKFFGKNIGSDYIVY